MILEKLYLTNCWYYFIVAITLSFVFRLILTFLRVLEIPFQAKKNGELNRLKNIPPRKRFKIIFHGAKDLSIDPTPDLWLNTVIGTGELIIFPFLLKGELYAAIGAWMVLKTTAQWRKWNDDRILFNHFLIANALVLVASYFLMHWFVRLDP